MSFPATSLLSTYATTAYIKKRLLKELFEACEDHWTRSHGLAPEALMYLRRSNADWISQGKLDINDMNPTVVISVTLEKMRIQLETEDHPVTHEPGSPVMGATLVDTCRLTGQLARDLTFGFCGAWSVDINHPWTYEAHPSTYDELIVTYASLYIATLRTNSHQITRLQDIILTNLLAKSLDLLFRRPPEDITAGVSRDAASRLSGILVDCLLGSSHLPQLTKDFLSVI